tara:strand:- start:1319 stop:3043 length:1725 start_codon:yes stop_codon:yes gene_type:complete
MISNVFKILEKKDFIKLQVIFLLNFFTFFFELLSLGLIPIFVSFIFEIQTVLDKFEKYGIFFFSNIDNDSLVKYLGIFIILVFIVKNIFYFFFVYIQGKFVANIKEKVSKKLLDFYVTCPFPFHLNNNPAQLTRNTTNSIDGLSIYILRLVELLKESLAILVILILLSFVNLPITLIIFLIFSFLGFLYINTIRPSYRKKAKANENYKINLIQTINETFGAIKDIKLHNKESEIISNYNKFRHNYEKNLFHFSIIQKIPRLLLETIAIFIITISALIFFNSDHDLLAFLTILSLIVVAIIRFIPAFNSIISSIFYIRMFEPSVEIIFNEFKKINNFKKRQVYKIQTSHKKILEPEKSFITLKDISFSYDNEANTTLKNINIDIEKGTIVGVTGETGAGKSTLFHIILGLLEPKSGVVLFKNQNINLDIINWRNQIGYIAQNIYLLDDTIEKNISFDFLEKEIDKERMNFAIEMSCLQKKILELPDGLRTKVGNDGLRLSGGEKQRIALARAIYKNPDIFFMDESTSALDSETEQKIMLNLKKNFSKKTIILIAHRKSTIEACDKVINIKNGVIV